jgi:hypothetical protein
VAAAPVDRESLRAEGVALAEARRGALGRLIPEDPREALRRAVPMTIRQEMPPEVVAQLEDRVSDRGFFGVLGALVNDGSPAIRREVRFAAGQHYEAFVFGRRERQQTTEQAHLSGVAVDRALALDERPLRVLEAGERPDPAKPVVETCAVSGKSTAVPRVNGALPPITQETPAVEIDGSIHYLCSGGHIAAVEESLLAEEGGLAREGSSGGAVKPTGAVPTTWNTGVKTHLYIRVTFPDQLQDPQSEKDSYDMMRQVDDFIRENSYGKCYFISTVTPLLVLPRTEAWYKTVDTSGSAYEVLTDARTVAKAAGYDPAQYDFDTVRYNGGPGGFGGQAYVTGKGCWLKSSGAGVACHEYGHNLGLWHANYWKTAPASVIGPGTNEEYGNSFDTMGAANAGSYHYGAYNKSVISWMTPELVTTVRESGTYRIFQHDQAIADPARRYGLKVAKDNDRNYWCELRQKFTSNAWMMSGLQLTWDAWGAGGAASANGSNAGAQLLDLTPGTPDAKTDSPLVIGRTFSDFEAGLHITPVGKGGTTPESMDVVVNLGSFPGNQAPTLAIAASATSVSTGTNVTLTATASDPDGDLLAYAWDFGDKAFSTTNLPVVTKSWSTAGLYTVRCTASDMKGKVTTQFLVITVGAPGTFTISGNITNPLSQPLEGVLVGNGGTGTAFRGAYTDSAGNYAVANLSAGSTTLSAQLPGYTFTAGFTNPVTVGPNATAKNFTSAAIATLSIQALDATATENGDTGTFRITRTGATTAAQIVRVNSPNGTATKGSDYTLSPDPTYNSTSGAYELTIPAGAATLDVTLTTVNDATQEGPETAILQLVPMSGTAITGAQQATIVIDDDDTALPRVSLAATDEYGSESGDPAQFTVTRTGPTTAALTVSFTTSGTATNGTDYANIGTSVTIPAGAASAPINIAPTDDTAVEGNETVTLTLASNAAYVRDGTAQVATATLNDNDVNVLTVAATDATANESGDTATFTITRTGDLTNALTVDYALGGSALHGTDYLRLPGVATIAAGATTTTVLVEPIDDSIGEAAQTVILQLRSKTTYLVGTAFSATATLNDNDLPAISVNSIDGIATEPASGSGTDTAKFRIYRAGGTSAFTVNYTIGGTATPGTDYTALSGSIAFASGDTTKDITVTPLADAVTEDTETVTLTLLPAAAYTVEPENSATVLVVDEDQVAVSASTEIATVTEASATMRFWISRTGSTTAALAVNYTMSGTATSGVDYTGATGTLTIPVAASGAYLTLTPVNDTLAEGTESVILDITPIPGTYGVGVGRASYQLGDNDTTGLPQVRFSAASGSGPETTAAVSIPVTLSAASASTVTVDYFLNGGSATSSGVDYTFTSGVLSFAPGVTSLAIPLTVIDDIRPENNETVVIALANPNGATLGTSSYTYTINDNDPATSVTVAFATPASSTLESVASPQTMLVTLSAAKGGAVTVNYAVTGGTASSPADYSLASGTLTFASGEVSKLLPISIATDAVVEGNETVIVTLSNPTGATLGANGQHTLTIVDDTTALSVAATDGTAAEPADPGAFTVMRAGNAASAMTVNVALSGTATNGVDYQSISSTLNFAAGQRSAIVPVTPIDDSIIEGGETVILTLNAGSGYVVVAPSSATVTISDTDRNAAPSFTKGADQNVKEDQGARTIAGWATNISAGAQNESSQVLNFIVSNDNPTLFAAAPAISSAGTLTFTPAADANGSARVTVILHDDGGTAQGGADTSAPQTFNISVTPVNDAPSFTKGANQTVRLAAGAQSVAGWATAINAGPADESAQTLNFIVSNDNAALFATAPAISSAGTLTFTPGANANGSATVTVVLHDDGGTAAGGSDTSAPQTFTIAVAPVNNPPSFTRGADQTLREDEGVHTVAGWATNLSAGLAGESSQALNFIVSHDNPTLFAAPPAISASGDLTFTPAEDANGSATVTVTLHDDGGTADGGSDTSAPQTFTISVVPVNDTPSFTKGANQTIQQGAGAQSVAGWATSISAGPADESGQRLDFIVSNDRAALFTAPPAVAPDGTLTFTPAAGASGSASVTVTVHDDGGTANGGADYSGAQTFVISIRGVNDAPTFTAGADQSAAQDAGPQRVPGWATDISPGPPDEAAQTVEFFLSVDNRSLFTVPPTITPDGTLSYLPSPNASGTATITVTLRDNGGTADGGIDTSAPQTFTIAVSTFAEEIGTYYGLVEAAAGTTMSTEQFGSAKVTLGKKGTFSALLKIAGKSFHLRGSFDNAGVAHFGRELAETAALSRKDLPDLVATLRLDVANGSDHLSGTLQENGADFAAIETDRALYPAGEVPADLPGDYTVLFATRTAANPGREEKTLPLGEGVGVMTVTAKGSAKLRGTLADGTAVSCASPLVKGNRWPFHVSMRGGKGSITGPAIFRDTPGASDFDGARLHWFKSASTAELYPDGWPEGLQTDLLGSKYVVPDTDESVLPGLGAADDDGNAELTFIGGDVPEPGMTAAVMVSPVNQATVLDPAHDVSMKFKSKSGYVSGDFLHPISQKAAKLKGVVFQKQKLGAGFFLGTTESGSFELVPQEHPVAAWSVP